MREEMRSHLELHVEDLIRSGVPPGEAARQARLAFGNLDSVKDDCRQSRGLWLFDELRRNVRHAARRLRQSPGFALTACATLALTLGANLTIFAVIDGILLRPLPFPRRRSPRPRLQLLSTGGRAGRWDVSHKLLRASRPHRSFLVAGGDPGEHRHRWRRRSHGTPADRAGHLRVLRDAWRSTRYGACLRG